MRAACGLMARLVIGMLIGAGLAQAAEAPHVPLSTAGRYVVDSQGERYKLRSANWYGFHHDQQVLKGLDRQPLDHIIGLFEDWGFNSVRLPFSNQMLHETRPAPDGAVAANPELRGLTPLQIFDVVIQKLTARGITVVLNNHTTSSEWCCNFDINGLWHNEGSGLYTQSTEQWVQDWLMLAQRYKNNSMVIGADLRNEVRTAKYRNTFIPVFPNWGSGDIHDWHKAATDAGNRILAVNPDLLIIVEGINWTGSIPLLGSGERPHLQPVRERPVNLIVPHKLVYAAHNYSFTGPQHTGDDRTSPGKIRYGQMDERTLRETLDREFGFVLNQDQYFTAPVWVSEFGAAAAETDPATRAWFSYLVTYLIEKDLDFAYWPFNHEGYGLVSEDYSRNLTDDWRYAELTRLIGAPSFPGPFSRDRLSRLAVSDRDENLVTVAGDWLPYTRKAACPSGERLVGLSQDHRALCLHQESFDPSAVSPRYHVEARAETAARPHGAGDWAPSSTKYECPLNYFAVGYAQDKGRATGLLCASASRDLSTSCRTVNISQGDHRLSSRGGDWAAFSHKGQCGDQDYLAGYAHKGGRVQALLCCAL
ncbi:glycoside hydrolase family 5 protein [Oligoflexus tunisiensis]|uniref:glycoside hydrolase family 5 protein n=1 Tax=Oligoflexus tunisiensis TaxID=708132 RepID=UPI000B10D0C1|nr:cellulase family glycosylhydrolase [Oligoflexus tunisiensis]